jgi:hypothetical protein
MTGDKIETYAFCMLVLQLSFVLLGLTGVFPYSLQIAGLNVSQDISDTINSIQTMSKNVIGEGIINSVAVTGFILIMGVKIIIEFLILCLTGAYPVMLALGLPASFSLPISVLISMVCIYTLAVKLLGR